MKFQNASLIASAAMLLGACASPPTLYYTLAAPATVPAVAPSNTAAPLWIELAPLAVPERLARPQLVVRSAGDATRSQVEILEQHRWASSFENEMRDALASGIAARLGALDGTKGGRPAAAPVSPSGNATHIIRSGDTLGALARHYRLRLRDLLDWNGLNSRSVLRPGQRIRLEP